MKALISLRVNVASPTSRRVLFRGGRRPMCRVRRWPSGLAVVGQAGMVVVGEGEQDVFAEEVAAVHVAVARYGHGLAVLTAVLALLREAASKLDCYPPVTRFMTRTRVGWSGFRLPRRFRLRLLLLVGDR
jgi:hypothetical protein